MAIGEFRFPTARDAGTKFPLTVCVDDEIIAGATVAEFLVNVLRYVDSRKLLPDLQLPFYTGGENYLIAHSPFHSTGIPFAAYAEYDCGAEARGLFVNTNHPRFFGLRQGARVLEAVGLDVYLPSG